MNLPIRLGPSSGRGEAKATVARHLPLATLCLPVDDEGCSNVGAVAGLVEGKALGVGEIRVIAVPKEEEGSPPTFDPSFMGTIVTQAGGSILTPCDEEVGLGEDPFIWPHLVGSHEALFMVNVAAKQATWGSALQSYVGVLATLSELANVAATIFGLGAKTQQLMIEEVVPHEQV